MASVEGLLSPESTVTSLLASSGHLRSSLYPEPIHTIRYGDREYESASDALDAYISDFQKSMRGPGQLQIPKELRKPRPFQSRFRNRDVLKESLTDRELDFLNLPVSSQRRDVDRFSTTTDDLLVLPPDGSLPVTRTSAFLSQPRSYSLGHGAHSNSRSFTHPKPTQHHSLPLRAPQRRMDSRTGKGLCLDDLLTGNVRHQRSGLPLNSRLSTQMNPPDTPPSHHLPRWMTSQKSEMDFSGVTSVPELQYPAWLNECDVPIGVSHSRPSECPRVPSWIGDLEESREEIQPDPQSHVKFTCETGKRNRSQVPLWETRGRNALRELRLKFAEQLSAAECVHNPDNGKPFRALNLTTDDKIESLILRAEQVLSSPSLGLKETGKGCDSPGDTEDVLDADRSWDNPPVAFKSPVPVGGTEDPVNAKELQNDINEKSIDSCSSGYSSRKHPGPVEALKHMLFSLQAVEQRVTQQNDPEPQGMASVIIQNPPTQAHNREADNRHTVVQPDIEDYDTAPGGQSLQRALHHLGRLKTIVDDMNEKKEKELQEGRSLEQI